MHQHIEIRQYQCDDSYGNGGGQQGHDQCLTHELCNEAAFSGAQHFSDADFFCPLFTAGCRQVHEVDAGDEENDPCNDGKQVHVRNPAATCLLTIVELIAQAPVVHAEQEKMDVGLWVSFLNIPVQLLIDGGGVSGRGKLYIGCQ